MRGIVSAACLDCGAPCLWIETEASFASLVDEASIDPRTRLDVPVVRFVDASPKGIAFALTYGAGEDDLRRIGQRDNPDAPWHAVHAFTCTSKKEPKLAPREVLLALGHPPDEVEHLLANRSPNEP